MELEELAKEPEGNVAKSEGASAMEEGKSEVEAERDVYAKLESPTEDFYTDAKFFSRSSKTKAGSLWQDVRAWRCVSLALGLLCLLLIIVIIALVFKRQSGGTSVSRGRVQKPPALADIWQTSQCAPGWLHHGDSCFFLSTRRKTWDEARVNCSERGGKLAVVTSPSVQKFLTENGKLPYWIGLKLDHSWIWVDNTHLTLSYWSDSSSGGNCAHLVGNLPSDKNWFKNSCSRPLYYICQAPVPKN